MNEREFRRLFHATIGEAPIPPDLDAVARRALRRKDRPRPVLFEALAAVAAIVIVAAVVTLSLVGHRGPAPAAALPVPSSSASPTAAPTASPTASPSASPTVAPSPSTVPAGPLPCDAAGLRLSSLGSQGAAGHRFVSLAVTNATAAACTIFGFPTAQLFAPDQSPIPTRVVDQGGQLSNTAGPAPIVLDPGQAARFQVSWGTIPVNGETCRAAARVEIGPPNQAPSPTLSAGLGSAVVCNAGELDVSAFVA